MVGKTVALRKRLLGAIASGLLLAGGMMATPSIAADAAPAAVAQKLQSINNIWSNLSATPEDRIRVIVEFSEPVTPAAESFATAAEADAALTRAIHGAQNAILAAVLPDTLSTSAEGSENPHNLVRMNFSPQFAINVNAKELEQFAANPNVVRIHENLEMHPMLDASLPLIQMPQMYAAGHQGTGYVVAVIDSGARSSHESITASRIVSAACFNTGTTAANRRCPGGVASLIRSDAAEDCTEGTFGGCGHGTHVTGTAMGLNTNRQSSEPASGVAKASRLISINTFNKAGSTNFDDVILGLEHVYNLRNTYNIAAVNLSIGVYNNPQYSNCDASMSGMKTIIDRLLNANIATVIAAGNDGFDTAVSIPSCISSAITVANSTTSRAALFVPSQGVDERANSSNWGNLIDIAAPGHVIYASGSNGDSFYTNKSGTSMAAPHVTGAWATLRSAHPNATVSQILAALQNTGTNITAAGVTKKRINVDAARRALGGDTEPPTGPANDNFANRITVAVPAAGSTRTVTGSNVGATAEAGEPFHAGLSGARNSVWWRYTPATSGSITITTAGSSFDTVLAVYTGSSVGALSHVASNDDSGGVQSSVTFTGTAGTQYQIAVAGYNNAAGNIRLNVTGGSPAPVPPANDNFANRIMIRPHGAIFGPRVEIANNTHATAEPGEPLHVNRRSATNSLWWRYTPATSGRITIDTKGSGFNTVLAVYVGGSVSNLKLVAWNDDHPDLGRRSKVTFDGVAGTQYKIAVAGGYGNSSGRIRMTLRGGGRYVVSSVGEQVASLPSTAPAVPAPESDAFTATVTASGTQAQSPARPAAAPLALQQGTSAGVSATRSGSEGDIAVAARSQPATRRPAPSASSNRVELVSTVVTPSDDGVLRVPAGGSGFTTLAVNNAGADATLTAELSLSPVPGAALPAGMSICRTDPATSTCVGARATSVTFEAASNAPVTFAAFVDHQDGETAYDPATRLYVHFRQGSTVVGTASVPVCTVGADGCEAGRRQTAGLTVAQ